MMRHYILFFMLSWTLPLTAFVGLNLLVDPYRIFHKPWVRDSYYTNDTGMRAEAAGIINTEDFDSIILGTSMAENFSAQEATQVFDSKFVNISQSGSSIIERAYTIEYALRKKMIEYVIFSIDWGTLYSDTIVGSPMASYTYLYDENRVNDLMVYAGNLRVFRYVFCRNIVVSSDALCKNRRGLENLVEWHSNMEHSKRFGGLNKWLAEKNNPQIFDALKSVSDSIHKIDGGEVKPIDRGAAAAVRVKQKNVFNQNVLKYAAEHPNTIFYLFFPPYSRLSYAISKKSDPQRFEEYLQILRFVVDESASYPNVRVFGFETEDFLDDIANYKDTSHYHQRYNSAMLRWMKAGEHELTLENIDPYIQEITVRADAYSLREIGAQINDYLMKKR